MTCSPQNYLVAAQNVQAHASNEGCFRAASNRSYYAAFHRCKVFIAALPQLNSVQGSGEHEQLINWLTFPSKKLTSNLQDRSTTIGRYLREMCDARVQADYCPSTVFIKDQMDESLNNAYIIFAGASETKGPISNEIGLLIK